MTNLKAVEAMAQKFENDVEQINKELKRIQSVKCRLKNQKGKKTYEDEMSEVLKYEQVLKEAKNLIDPREKPVTMFVQDDVEKLDYDETIKAIKSIQSKKTLTKWQNEKEGDNDDYRAACKIEELLLKRRDQIKPVKPENVRKTEVQSIIETIESSGKLSQEAIVELLKKLV